METRARRKELEKQKQEEDYAADTEEDVEMSLAPKVQRLEKRLPVVAGLSMQGGSTSARAPRTMSREAGACDEMVDAMGLEGPTNRTANGQLDGRMDDARESSDDEATFSDCQDSEEMEYRDPHTGQLKRCSSGELRVYCPDDIQQEGQPRKDGPEDDAACEAPALKRNRDVCSPKSSLGTRQKEKRTRREESWETRDRERMQRLLAHVRQCKVATVSGCQTDERSKWTDKNSRTTNQGRLEPNTSAHSNVTGILRYRTIGGALAGLDIANEDVYGQLMKRETSLAYPYRRRYALGSPDHDPDCYFKAVGALADHETLHEANIKRRPPLHHDLVRVLAEADSNLEHVLDDERGIVGTPDFLRPETMNSSIHDYWQPTFTVTPFSQPNLANLSHAAAARWMEVQRGTLQRMEELVRLALFNQSATQHARDQITRGKDEECTGLTSAKVLHYVTDQNTRVLVEFLHQLTYAHRRAYIHHAPVDVQRNVLRQPVTGQQELFKP